MTQSTRALTDLTLPELRQLRTRSTDPELEALWMEREIQARTAELTDQLFAELQGVRSPARPRLRVLDGGLPVDVDAGACGRCGQAIADPAQAPRCAACGAAYCAPGCAWRHHAHLDHAADLSGPRGGLRLL